MFSMMYVNESRATDCQNATTKLWLELADSSKATSEGVFGPRGVMGVRCKLRKKIIESRFSFCR